MNDLEKRAISIRQRIGFLHKEALTNKNTFRVSNRGKLQIRDGKTCDKFRKLSLRVKSLHKLSTYGYQVEKWLKCISATPKLQGKPDTAVRRNQLENAICYAYAVFTDHHLQIALTEPDLAMSLQFGETLVELGKQLGVQLAPIEVSFSLEKALTDSVGLDEANASRLASFARKNPEVLNALIQAL